MADGECRETIATVQLSATADHPGPLEHHSQAFINWGLGNDSKSRTIKQQFSVQNSCLCIMATEKQWMRTLTVRKRLADGFPNPTVP
jgi:hypothetical protein